MPANPPPMIRAAALVGLGLISTACGPIAFQDTVELGNPEPAPAPTATAAPAPAKPTVIRRAKLTGDQIVIDDKIQFGRDSAEILEVSFPLLDDVVAVMQDNPQIEQLDIVGHTSSEGSKKHNDKLSADRAAAVVKYLVDHGIDAGRLISEGKGPSEPIADNDTEEGRVANRRVEFKVTKTGAAPADAAKTGGARARPGT